MGQFLEPFSYPAIVTYMDLVIDVVLVFLMLTLKHCTLFSSVSTVDFKQLNFSWLLSVLRIINNENGFPFLHKTPSISINWNILLRKTIILWTGVQSVTIFKTQRKSSIFKKMFFSEINEIHSSSSNPGNLHFLFFMCCWLIFFLITFVDCSIKLRVQISLFSTSKDDQPKTPEWNQLPMQGKLLRASQALI